MISIFGFSLRLYGLLIGIAILVASEVSAKVALQKGISEKFFWNGLWWCVGFGLIGARAYHVIDLWDYYSRSPTLIPQIWQGGLGIFGALVGGALGILAYLWFSKNKGMKTESQLSMNQASLILFDSVAISIPLAQSIGRWGNYFNQELFGKPLEGFWSVYISPANRPVGYEFAETYHPLFAYESILNLLLFLGIFGSYKGWFGPALRTFFAVGSGRILAGYMIGYGLIRFVLEPLRIEPWQLGSIPTASLFSAGLLLMGLVILFVSVKKKGRSV